MKRTIFSTWNYREENYISDTRQLIAEASGEKAEDISEERIEEEINLSQSCDYEDETDRIKSLFREGKKFILTGYAGLWSGKSEGGKVCETYNELCRAWEGYDDINLYDDNGMFVIEASHHDGTNQWKVKELNERGLKFLEKNRYMDRRELCEKLFTSRYSKRIMFADRFYGRYRAS